MRVIAGNLRGRKLLSPKDETVRPTTDRVKESMFNLINEFIDYDTIVYDIFSGTGGLGIEALSRGASKAYFCDNNRDSYNLTRENLKICRLEDKSTVFFGNYKKALIGFTEKADLILMDPPYGLDLWGKCSNELIIQNKLNDGAVIVMEHGIENELMNINPLLELIKERKYGAIVVSIYRYTPLSEDK